MIKNLTAETYLYLDNNSQKQHILPIKINLKTYKCSEKLEITCKYLVLRKFAYKYLSKENLLN